MKAQTFAKNEYLDYVIYSELEKIEKNPEFKKFLKTLIKDEFDHFNFWLQFSPKKNFRVSRIKIFSFIILRKILGLAFTAKYLEHHERDTVSQYTEFLSQVKDENAAKLKEIIEHEQIHEKELIRQFHKEERVEFIGSIILGLNDALIELTGILVGFAFIFSSTTIVSISGLISGIAASLSMASSGYMQARQEQIRDAKKSALYTGVSYLTVVLLLVLPYFIADSMMLALGIMFVIVLAIILITSIYTSVLFDRQYKTEFLTMFLASMGVSAISFILGTSFRKISGIDM